MSLDTALYVKYITRSGVPKAVNRKFVNRKDIEGEVVLEKIFSWKDDARFKRLSDRVPDERTKIDGNESWKFKESGLLEGRCKWGLRIPSEFLRPLLLRYSTPSFMYSQDIQSNKLWLNAPDHME
jgi:hypothetical protein